MFKRVGLEAVKLIESQLDDNHGEYHSYPDFFRKRGSIKASDNLGHNLWKLFLWFWPLLLLLLASQWCGGWNIKRAYGWPGQKVMWVSWRLHHPIKASVLHTTFKHMYTHTHICDMPRRCWNKVHIISARPTTGWMTKSNIKESSMLMQSFIGWCMSVSKITSGPPVWDPFEALISISGWEFQDNPCPTSGSPIWESYQSWSEPPTFWHAQPGPANTRGVYLMDILIAQEKEVNKRGH